MIKRSNGKEKLSEKKGVWVRGGGVGSCGSISKHILGVMILFSETVEIYLSGSDCFTDG